MLKYQLQDTSVFSKQTQSVLKFPYLFHVYGSDSCYPLIFGICSTATNRGIAIEICDS